MGSKREGVPVLTASERPLTAAYDLAMLDLDGVVYISGHAVPGAAEAIAAARDAGMTCGFVTNNASRTPESVARHLTSLGVAALPRDVVTSAQAAARLIAARVPPESRVLMVGGEGLAAALIAEALIPVTAAEDGVVAVVTGYGPDVLWRDIMRAAVLIREGLWWVATNADLSLPTAYGTAPGHGVLVGMIEQFSGVSPETAGKPHRPLLDETIRRLGGQRPLMVGDRLDTDIEGAGRAGLDSLLVLTGVTGLAELAAAPPALRPTYLASDLTGLLRSHPAPVADEAAAVCGGWTARVADGRLGVTGQGITDDWWRAAAVAAWRHLDAAGAPADLTGVQPPATGVAGLAETADRIVSGP